MLDIEEKTSYCYECKKQTQTGMDCLDDSECPTSCAWCCPECGFVKEDDVPR